MRAQDVMSSPVVTVRPEDSVKLAAKLLADNGFTALPVTDDGNLVGMITEADVLRDRVPPDARTRIWQTVSDHAYPPETVADVMHIPVVGVTPGTDVADVVDTMLTSHVRSVPVVDGSTIVGIITRRDVVQAIATDDETVLTRVRCRLSAYGPSYRWTVSVRDGVVMILDEFDDATDRHVAKVIAESVPGVIAATVRHRTQESAL